MKWIKHHKQPFIVVDKITDFEKLDENSKFIITFGYDKWVFDYESERDLVYENLHEKFVSHEKMLYYVS